MAKQRLTPNTLRAVAFILAICSLILISPMLIEAQSNVGRISGTVMDFSGLPCRRARWLPSTRGPPRA